MGTNSSMLAYEDIRELMDRAISSENGVATIVDTYGAAIRLRQRIYAFRNLSRKQSTKIYQLDDPMFGKTVYDNLVVPQFEKIAGIEKIEVKILKTTSNTLEVREL